MKKWLLIILSFVALSSYTWVLQNKYKKAQKNYSNAMINFKASQDEDQNKIFELTMAQIYQMEKSDSLLKRVHELAEENGIKDKRILALQYTIDNFTIADTVYLKDSIFVNVTPDFKQELHFGDEWYNLDLLLEYPNTIGYNIGIRSEKNMIMHENKEFIKPRKNFFISRWFQKKHLVIEVLIEEENPYVNEDTREHKFIKVVK